MTDFLPLSLLSLPFSFCLVSSTLSQPLSTFLHIHTHTHTLFSSLYTPCARTHRLASIHAAFPLQPPSSSCFAALSFLHLCCSNPHLDALARTSPSVRWKRLFSQERALSTLLAAAAIPPHSLSHFSFAPSLSLSRPPRPLPLGQPGLVSRLRCPRSIGGLQAKVRSLCGGEGQRQRGKERLSDPQGLTRSGLSGHTGGALAAYCVTVCRQVADQQGEGERV